MRKVVYLAFYAGKNEKRLSSPAADAVTKYTAEALSKQNIFVELISPAQSSSANALKQETVQKNNIKITYIKASRHVKKFNLLARFLERKKHKKRIISKLQSVINDGDVLLVYHSLYLMDVVKQIKKERNIKLVLQVCEIYSDVLENKYTKYLEMRYFKQADAYVFPTKLLDNIVNVHKKPSVIVHGTYYVEKECGQPFNDGRVHVVYAGTFDPRKGGVQAAAAAAEFLTGKYHVHILGFGSEVDKQNLLKTIADVSKKSECTITYDGLKSGEEYIKFIQSCNIGLSTQNPDAAFIATSFPSKILSYMANGLRVVSIRIPAIEQSAVGDYMYYYDRQTPEDIARAIMQVDLNDGYDERSVIKKLNVEFLRNIKQLIDEVTNENY